MNTSNTVVKKPLHTHKFNIFANVLSDLLKEQTKDTQIKVTTGHAMQVKIAHRPHPVTYGILNQTMKSVPEPSKIRIHFNDTSDSEFEAITSSLEAFPHFDSTHNSVHGIELSTKDMNEQSMKELATILQNAL